MTKRSIHRTTFILAFLVVATLAFVIARSYVSTEEIPLPFGYQAGSSLQGQVTQIGIKNGFPVKKVTFPAGTDSETLTMDSVYLVVIPDEAAVSTVPLDFVLSVLGNNSVNYFGYLYTTPDASDEKAHRTDPLLTDRFPGQFFVSAKARAEDAQHGNAIAAFEAEHGITMSPTDGTVGSALLNPNSLYFIIVNESNPAMFAARLPVVCSDGWVDQRGPDGIAGNADDEQCDDGNAANGDGCSDSCQVEQGYVCNGNPSQCTGGAICGNLAVESPEECDDGNVANGDGCSSTCEYETLGGICGDGTIVSPEECDDANTASGDGCSSACDVESGYQCMGTPSVCTVIPVCGNMVVEYPEVCDDGNNVNTDSCTNICQAADCGDGYLQTQNNEQCDDGNTIETDDCDNSCQLTLPIPNI